MTPLPLAPAPPNTCVPRCGACCGGATPIFAAEVAPLLAHLQAAGRRTEKQLRTWGGDLSVCPFLTPDKRCFVYEVRPAVCRAFGHIKLPPEAKALRIDLTCPLEAEGRTFFDPWPLERVREFDEVHDVTRPDTKVVPLALLGAEIRRALKRDGKVEVPYLTTAQWLELTAGARATWARSEATGPSVGSTGAPTPTPTASARSARAP